MSNTITFMPLGGGREIGANSYLVRANGCDVLLDCGVHPKKEGTDALPQFGLLDRPIDAAVVSHGHVDHCGAVPMLLKQFPQATPYATTATVSVMDRMLHNSVAVMGALAKERGIRGYPLYEHNDVDYAIRRTWGIRFGQEFMMSKDGGVRAQFYPAGHVLGGASTLLKLPGHTLFYTGDICAADQELLSGRATETDALAVDTLVIESTYGADGKADQTSYEEEIVRFAAGVREVLERGGVALVPCFALGRTQEMLNIIARLQEEGRLPDVPVLSSGLGRAIYEVYRMFPEYLSPTATLRPLKQFGRVGDAWNPRNVQNLLRKPAIIVATSGMMIENTPSALIAQELVKHPEHGVFFVGYLDPDTLGFKLLHSEPGCTLRFQLDRPEVEVKLSNIQWFYFSAHAPREALRDVIACMKPKNVVFVHGDPEAIDWMCAHCGGVPRQYAPEISEAITLEA